jgi:hypothetical protein
MCEWLVLSLQSKLDNYRHWTETIPGSNTSRDLVDLSTVHEQFTRLSVDQFACHACSDCRTSTAALWVWSPHSWLVPPFTPCGSRIMNTE